MKSPPKIIIIGLLTMVLGSLSCQPKSMGAAERRVSTPHVSARQKSEDKPWQGVFYPIIKERTEIAHLKFLRDVDLLENSLEVRIWVGVDAESLRAMVLSRSQGQWAAVYLPPLQSSLEQSSIPLSRPKCGWECLWEKLNRNDILTLPDAVDIGADNVDPDALAIVVESKSDNLYRAYNYNGFDVSEHPAAQKVSSICQILSEEFDVFLC